MNSKPSTLNPYAESYVPLFKRESKHEDEAHNKTHSEKGNDLKLKAQHVDDPFASLSENSDQMEGKFADEDSEMDLAYLQMTFPGICEQSLVDVYTVNRGDLESAIDMLNHLESVDNLPDALDIEVAAPKPTGECSSIRGLNAAANESSTSAPDLTAAT